jgi:hypothetical protein
MACYLKCGTSSSLKAFGVVDTTGSPICPYSNENPLFSPLVQSSHPQFPADYLSPSVLKIIQAAPLCSQGLPSELQPLCFECKPRETNQLATDAFFEIQFNSETGPGLFAVIVVFIFEHLVFCIKVPDFEFNYIFKQFNITVVISIRIGIFSSFTSDICHGNSSGYDARN